MILFRYGVQFEALMIAAGPAARKRFFLLRPPAGTQHWASHGYRQSMLFCYRSNA
jgi:hypothetical protein